MKVSFNEIGEKAVTFLDGGCAAGQVVKMSGNGAVAACADGDRFCGVALTPRGGCVGVAVGGFVRCAYSGAAPGVGYVGLAADGAGGVKALDGGREHLVVDVDEAGQTVTFVM